ncbi:MAG: hypothetical protein ABH846_00155 [Patescibacteria group bacterium]
MKMKAEQKNTALLLLASLTVMFIVIVIQMTVLQDLLSGIIFLLPFLLWAIVGGILVIYALANKWPKLLQWSLMGAGCAAIGMIIGILAHNFFYAVAEMSYNESVYSVAIIEVYSVFFFIEAVVVCPLIFIVSLISSFILLLRK